MSFAELKKWSGLFMGKNKLNQLIALDPFSYKDTEETSWNFLDLFLAVECECLPIRSLQFSEYHKAVDTFRI
jgi:hypothetical protein